MSGLDFSRVFEQIKSKSGFIGPKPILYFRCHKYKAVLKRVSRRYKAETAVKTAVSNCSDRMSRAISCLEHERDYQSADKQQPNILYVDGLSAKPFWSEEEFVSDITILESEIGSIVSEFENAYNNVWPNGWLVNTTPTGEWAVFHLINQGAYIKSNCEKCPQTFEILKKLVSSMSTSQNLFANASFSVVQSGTDIAAHYGPTNVRIRCHLGLKVSDPQSSYLTVDGKKGLWEAGKCLIFDDSFLHQVHHSDSDSEARAVLLVDMWHPELTESEREIIDDLFKFQKPPTPAIPSIPINISTDL